jgi:RNA polymerase sigma factor (sigma-70 family)
VDEQMTEQAIQTLTIVELGQAIVTECENKAKKIIRKYNLKSEEWTELSSFLRVEVWEEIHNRPEFHNIRFIRHLINKRHIDYFRSDRRFADQIPFCAFESEHKDLEDETEFNYGFDEESNTRIEDEFILKQELTSFISTLSKREKQVLKLVSEGYRKNEICDMLGISINTPANTMKKIKEKANDFGLKLF